MEMTEQVSSADKLVTVYLPDNQVLRGLLFMLFLVNIRLVCPTTFNCRRDA